MVAEETIDQFWLEGPSNITSRQQMNFLQKLIDGKLLASNEATGELTELMELEEYSEYALDGTTGWSVRGRQDIGWFIGWYQT